MDNELISIVIPVYNVEKYLHRCLDSVKYQTYSELQIILVDDGSTDSSGKILDEYAQSDERFIVIHKENGGLSDARNEGMKHIHGQFFCFIDSDDFVHPSFIEVLYKTIKKWNAKIAICERLEVIEESDDYIELLKNNGNKINDIDTYNERTLIGTNVFIELYKQDSVDFIVAWNKLYSSDLIDVLSFPIGKIHEDEFAIPKTLYNADIIVYKKIPLYYYIRRSGSITVSKFDEKQLQLEEALMERVDFYAENDLKELIGAGMHHLIGQCFYDFSRIDDSDDVVLKKMKKRLLRKLTRYYIKYISYVNGKKYEGKRILKEWIGFR